MTGEPLALAGAVQDTVAAWLPAIAAGEPGDVGAPTVVRTVVAVGPRPRLLMAATRNVYVVPLVRPTTVWVVAVELNVWAGFATAPTYGVIT